MVRNEQMVKKISWTAILVSLSVVTMMWIFVSTGDPSGLVQAEDRAKAPATLVQVSQPVTRALTRTLRIPATLQAIEAADLYAKTSGYVSSVAVDIGSRVKKGDALLSIDVPEMADELRQAEAVFKAKQAKVRALEAKGLQAESMVAIARAEVQRYAAEYKLQKLTTDRRATLIKENAISQQDFDEVTSRLAIAEAQVKIAEAKVAGADAEKQAADASAAVARSEVAVEEARLARLRTLMGYVTIRAPFTGVITERMVDPGAFVRSAAEGTTGSLLRIADFSRIRLVLQIPEVDAPFIKIGTEVEIVIKALGSEPIRAAIARTAVALKASTRTMRVEVDLDNSSGRLAPGMYAQVSVTLETKSHAMLVPSKAIRVRGRELSVWVAEGGVVKALPIKAGYDDGIWAEVLEGLSGSEQIILSATSKVSPGASVQTVQVKSSS